MSETITTALKAAQKPVTSYLWTPDNSITFTPAVLERVFGDGRALFSITTINDRPAYWIIRGCSTWMISGDYRAPDGSPDFGDFADDILTAIEEEYGTSDYYELNAQHRWIDSETKKFVPTSWAEFPVINTHDGCSWGRLDWPALDGVEIEAHPFANRGNVLKVEATPPAVVCSTCDGTGKEGRHSICRDCDEPPSPQKRAEPVDNSCGDRGRDDGNR